MKKTYETMLLLDNREVKKGWDALKDDVLALFTKHESEVVSARRWDERRLAYPIKGQQRGTYLLVYHNAPTGGVSGIERDLRYADPVLRSMTTSCEAIPEEAYQPEAEFDLSAVPVDEEPAVEPATEAAPVQEGEGKADAEAGEDTAPSAAAEPATPTAETTTDDEKENKE